MAHDTRNLQSVRPTAAVDEEVSGEVKGRCPRAVRGTRVRKLEGFTTNTSLRSSSRRRSAVLPMSNLLIPERDMAPSTTMALRLIRAASAMPLTGPGAIGYRWARVMREP